MSKVAVSKEKIVAVADAIREKTETSESLGLDAMPQAIRDIKSGGGDLECFISGVDMPTEFSFDGECIKSYLYYSGTSAVPLHKINLPNVKQIGERAFYCHVNIASSNNGVYSINMPNVESIGTYAFKSRFADKDKSDDTVKHLNLPKLRQLYTYAFQDCDAIITATFPEVTSIPGQTFIDCSNLTYVDIAKATTIQSSAFQGCSSLTGLNCPSVKSVQGSAFTQCTSLIKLSFPSLTSLSSGAFKNIRGASSGLTIDIGEGLASIPSQAFYGYSSGISNISAVVLRRTSVVSLANSSVFDYSWIKTETDNGFVYVPDDLVDSYKTATNWSTIADKIKPLSEYVEVEA